MTLLSEEISLDTLPQVLDDLTDRQLAMLAISEAERKVLEEIRAGNIAPDTPECYALFEKLKEEKAKEFHESGRSQLVGTTR